MEEGIITNNSGGFGGLIRIIEELTTDNEGYIICVKKVRVFGILILNQQTFVRDYETISKIERNNL
jgi:hypothetical protein